MIAHYLNVDKLINCLGETSKHKGNEFMDRKRAYFMQQLMQSLLQIVKMNNAPKKAYIDIWSWIP